VSTLQPHDLPGCDITTLSRCVNCWRGVNAAAAWLARLWHHGAVTLCQLLTRCQCCSCITCRAVTSRCCHTVSTVDYMSTLRLHDLPGCDITALSHCVNCGLGVDTAAAWLARLWHHDAVTLCQLLTRCRHCSCMTCQAVTSRCCHTVSTVD